MSYYAHSEASQAAAKTASHQPGVYLVPYSCTVCGYWHLAPKDAKPANPTCKLCLDSGGHSKTAFQSMEEALSVAETSLWSKGVLLSVYRCPHGLGWHLTSKEVRNHSKKRKKRR